MRTYDAAEGKEINKISRDTFGASQLKWSNRGKKRIAIKIHKLNGKVDI